MSRACNEYTLEHWLARDPRLKGSLAVAPQDPEGAAAEIRRLGDHPDFVQVMVSAGARRPYGEPFYHPIWEAAAEMDIPIAIHLGGKRRGLTLTPASRWPPTFYYEHHALLCEGRNEPCGKPDRAWRFLRSGPILRSSSLNVVSPGCLQCCGGWIRGIKHCVRKPLGSNGYPANTPVIISDFTTQPLEQPANKETSVEHPRSN